MVKNKYDFCGWATKNDLKCSDGRTIRRNAFKHCDGMTVPIVWQHLHSSPENILGHGLLENRAEGVYVYGKFNSTKAGKDAKLLVEHGDINALSIYANHLQQKGGDVLHGDIKEVSLVLSGANPGASIEFPIMAHGEEADDEAILFTGEYLAHDEDDDEDDEYDEEEVDDEDSDDDDEEDDEMEHADGSEKTVGDVVATMNKEQKDALMFLVGEALSQSDDKEDDDDEVEHSDYEGETGMKRNVFESDAYDDDETVLSHDDLAVIFNDATRLGSLKSSVLAHAAEYGIENIEWLFPEARNINGNGAPEFIKRQPDEWVSVVMNGVHHTPFSRIKMMFADLREDEARAKGYAKKGKLKKEEVFGLLKRSITPTTVYKKQKLDRDDVVDITDFDVVSWLKGEMRMMLDEELARAFIFGDGRTALDEDKISESHIIPVVADADFYALKKEVVLETGEELGHAIIRTIVKGLDDYEGSGNTIFFTKQTYVSDMLLMEDGFKHRLYNGVSDIANAMAVKRIVTVPNAIVPEGIYGVVVDLKDYNVGADKGGAINMFDDFDIDYNQMKYLIETRCSGALTRPFSALVIKEDSGN